MDIETLDATCVEAFREFPEYKIERINSTMAIYVMSGKTAMYLARISLWYQKGRDKEKLPPHIYMQFYRKPVLGRVIVEIKDPENDFGMGIRITLNDFPEGQRVQAIIDLLQTILLT